MVDKKPSYPALLETYVKTHACKKKQYLKKDSILKNLFIWLLQVLFAACGVFSCGMQTLSCGHVGFSSLTRDWTRGPCIGSTES